jgi:hypothetical protein
MPRGLGFVIVGILAVIGGAAFVGLLLRNKLRKKVDRADFDEFDGDLDDIEFEEYFSDEYEEYDEDDADASGTPTDVGITAAESENAPVNTDTASDDDDMQTNSFIPEKEDPADAPAASTEPEEVK